MAGPKESGSYEGGGELVGFLSTVPADIDCDNIWAREKVLPYHVS